MGSNYLRIFLQKSKKLAYPSWTTCEKKIHLSIMACYKVELQGVDDSRYWSNVKKWMLKYKSVGSLISIWWWPFFVYSRLEENWQTLSLCFMTVKLSRLSAVAFIFHLEQDWVLQQDPLAEHLRQTFGPVKKVLGYATLTAAAKVEIWTLALSSTPLLDSF